MHLVSNDEEVETFNDETEMSEDALQPFPQEYDEDEGLTRSSSESISPFQIAVQSTQEMRDMFRWWTQQSTPISDDDESSDEECNRNENEERDQRQTTGQVTSQVPQRGLFRAENMAKRWRQKRVVPGLYGLVMYNNEIKEERLTQANETPPATTTEKEEDVFLVRFTSAKGGGGFYEKQSIGTCATEAMTEASGHSHDLSEGEVGAAGQDVAATPSLAFLSEAQQQFLEPQTQRLTVAEEEPPKSSPPRTILDERDQFSFASRSFRPIDEDLDTVAMQDMESFRKNANEGPSKRRKPRTLKERLFCFGVIFTIVGLITVLVLFLRPSDDGSGGSQDPGATDNDGGNADQSNTDKLKDVLSDVALDGGAEFEDPKSYQYQALYWLSSDSQIERYSNQRTVQRWVLACIYFSTNNVTDVSLKWIASDNWIDADVHECDWKGIVCNDIEDERSVVSIHLRNNRLTGTFPAEVSLLSESLEVLDLNRNFIVNEGAKGHMFLEQLTNLRKLDFGSNFFVYNEGIPPQMQKLTNLVELDVSNTRYNGTLHGEVFMGMQSLKDLRLGKNSYNSSIPIEIGNLPSLENLHVENAGITGDLSFMKPMENIFEVWLDQNPGLATTLPTFLGEMESLVSVSISGCSLTGTIPTELGLLEDLQLLWLNNNDLSGGVPSELGQLRELRRIDIKGNDLTGQMPLEICSNTQFPNGFLAVLEADCQNEIECSCCSGCF